MATPEQIVDTAIRHQVLLEGLKESQTKTFAQFLKRIDKRIRKRLENKELTEFNRNRLEKLLKSIDADLKVIYQDHSEKLTKELVQLAKYEAESEARALNEVMVNFETVVPSNNQVMSAVFTRPLSMRDATGGKILKDFVKSLSVSERNRVVGAIRQAAFEGQTNHQILKTIRGTRANRYKDGILNISSRNAKAVIRTSVQHVAVTAREKTWEANSDIIKGSRWVSTLDSRTSTQCRSLDGTVFDLGKGPRPPIHINCRSRMVPELDERFAYLDKGATRASENGQVSADLTYYEWLKTQSKDFQDHAIGKERGNLFRNGGLSSEKFAELNLNKNFKPLTLAEMRKLEPFAFGKAASAKPLKKQAVKAKVNVSSDRETLTGWMGEQLYRQTVGELQNPRIKKAMRGLNLTQEEQVVARNYTYAGHADLNSYIWGDKVKNPEEVSGSIEILRRAIDKLPKYEGVTFRRTDLPESELIKHQKGSFVTYSAFTSTSYEKELSGFGSHRIIINGKSGRRMGDISHFGENEREVLFTSPTRFYVEDRYLAKDGILTIILTEVGN